MQGDNERYESNYCQPLLRFISVFFCETVILSTSLRLEALQMGFFGPEELTCTYLHMYIYKARPMKPGAEHMLFFWLLDVNILLCFAYIKNLYTPVRV